MDAEEIIRQAENSKATILGPSGKSQPCDLFYPEDNEFICFMQHVDKALQAKIQRGDFIDLSKLLTKRSPSEDNGLEIMSKNGKSYF